MASVIEISCGLAGEIRAGHILWAEKQKLVEKRNG